EVGAVVGGDAADVQGHPRPERERRAAVGPTGQDDGLEPLLALCRQHATSRPWSGPFRPGWYNRPAGRPAEAAGGSLARRRAGRGHAGWYAARHAAFGRRRGHGWVPAGSAAG